MSTWTVTILIKFILLVIIFVFSLIVIESSTNHIRSMVIKSKYGMKTPAGLYSSSNGEQTTIYGMFVKFDKPLESDDVQFVSENTNLFGLDLVN